MSAKVKSCERGTQYIIPCVKGSTIRKYSSSGSCGGSGMSFDIFCFCFCFGRMEMSGSNRTMGGKGGEGGGKFRPLEKVTWLLHVYY